MPYFEMPNRPDHGQYEAVIATDDVYGWGRVMIRPPFSIGEGLLGLLSGDDVKFSHHATTEAATVLSFTYPDATDSPDENLPVIASEVDFLLHELGHADSRIDFIAHWAKFNDKGE